MRYFEFDDQEKIACFDELASQFYYANFGRMTKSDFELMMFNFYYKKIMSVSKNEDGTIDYSKCSEYRISQDLGITQQKVKNLKVKNQLVNPIEYDWKKELAKLVENARYDQVTGRVSVNIPDPNLFIDIRNYIEEQGAYVDIQLNSKLLQLRAEYYIDLIIALENTDESRKKIIKEIRKQFIKSGRDAKAFDESNVARSLIRGTVDITTVLANISAIVSPTNLLAKALINLITKVTKE